MASKSLGGHTLFELWFSARPNLSHLHEIRCRTYILISGPNPKVATHSVECVFISYALNAKAY